MRLYLTKQKPIAVHHLEIGKITIYLNIIVCEFKEGVHINFENTAFPIQIIQMTVGDKKPIVYISHRRNSYSWNPIRYGEVIDLFPNLIAFGIVAENKRRRTIAELEQHFIKVPIKLFTNIEDAFLWASEIIEDCP